MERTSRLLGELPPEFWDVAYAGSRHPGSPAVAERPGIAAGANCQLYAYAVLAHLGRELPPFRSEELWADTRWSVRVPPEAPRAVGDLLLFNRSAEAFGAHIGVWAGEGDQVLHLCAELGRPAVWRAADFEERERYRLLVGIKRVTTRPGNRSGNFHSQGL